MLNTINAELLAARVAMADTAGNLHATVVLSEDLGIGRADGPVRQASVDLLTALILAAYGAEMAPRIWENWRLTRLPVSTCAAMARDTSRATCSPVNRRHI